MTDIVAECKAMIAKLPKVDGVEHMPPPIDHLTPIMPVSAANAVAYASVVKSRKRTRSEVREVTVYEPISESFTTEFHRVQTTGHEIYAESPVPDPKSIADCSSTFGYVQNKKVLSEIESAYGFKYYPGQIEYLACVACKDRALLAAQTGCGKSLFGVSLYHLKKPKRMLIIAPQGTVRSSECGEGLKLSAAQWLVELERFAGDVPVRQLFYKRDVEVARESSGIFVSYYQAMFTNSSKLVDDVSGMFDMVIADEFHYAKSIGGRTTKGLLGLQPKFRYGMTATPITDRASDLFALLGWLCVDGWMSGGMRDQFPFTVNEYDKFIGEYLCIERDCTEEAKRSSPWNKARIIRVSPVVSKPEKLARLLAPTVAFITKKDCNPNYQPPIVNVSKVAMGTGQLELYRELMDRSIIDAPNPYLQASKQVVLLRTACASPSSFNSMSVKKYIRPVDNDFNPKMYNIIRRIIGFTGNNQQVLVVCSRTRQTDEIAKWMGELGIKFARIDSKVPPQHHAYEANLFKERSVPVCLMGIKCAAAYSFGQCENMLIPSMEYSWGVLDQAMGRIDRVTCERPANIEFLVCQGSIEEIVLAQVMAKGRSANAILSGGTLDVFSIKGPDDLMAKSKKIIGDISRTFDENELVRQFREEMGL